MTIPKVIVCQHGARRRYAVPRILEAQGMLHALYTDSSEVSSLGRAVRHCSLLRRGRLARLANRQILGIPAEKIFSSDKPVWQSYLKRGDFLDKSDVLSKAMIKWGLGESNIVYSMYCESLGFLRYAKSRNRKIIVDVYSLPAYQEHLEDEYLEVRGFGLSSSERIYVDQIKMRFCEIANLADVLIAPSQFVSDGIQALCPEHKRKIYLCPYGASINFSGQSNSPVPGRVFWAGGAWIIKGLVYLARAADKLKERFPEIAFRVAGVSDPTVTHSERFRNLQFLGKLNYQQMQVEYLSADMFVFPTLSEGLSGVVIEALSAGCPVITTRCAGIDAISNGSNGIIVSPRDHHTLAMAIEAVYSDRSLRDSLASSAAKLANYYTESAWAQRLTSLMKKLMQ